MRASGYDRHADDWYVEPAWCVDALVKAERPFIGAVLDPCCGGGNIVTRLRAHGVHAQGADIRDRAAGQFPVMGYAQSLFDARPDSVVSNPPYGLAQDFIDSCLTTTTDRVCVLLRLAFLEGQKRSASWKGAPLARVWVCGKRVSMPPGGTDIPAKGGSIAYAWFVFERGHTGSPVLGWLPDVEKMP
ncbi:hypothetical protein AD952_11110 [Acetobacter cerevisiae]|uniref:Methyltransferase n=1 Tax=Acetobacter cerevisiae TaxID=178900 RepID=A0A149UT95_9PROT|nr:hypothetical protein [Acetobacter cerevisiae]KXV70986.1 hypothetical protein AD952_11110 [Acetobacter cerevisiae]